jgi:hypothetical protein
MSFFMQPELDKKVGCHLYALADFVAHCTSSEMSMWPRGDHETMIDLMDHLSVMADSMSKSLYANLDVGVKWTEVLTAAHLILGMEDE